MCLQFSMALIYHAAFNVCSLVYEIQYFNFEGPIFGNMYLEICPLTFHGWGMIQSVRGLAVAAWN